MFFIAFARLWDNLPSEIAEYNVIRNIAVVPIIRHVDFDDVGMQHKGREFVDAILNNVSSKSSSKNN